MFSEVGTCLSGCVFCFFFFFLELYAFLYFMKLSEVLKTIPGSLMLSDALKS